MRLLSVLLVVVSWLSAPAAAQPASRRQTRERDITLLGVDSSLPAVYVAGHRPTVLEFGFPVSKDGVRLTVVNPAPQLMVAANQLVLLPAEDIRTEEQVTLVVDSPQGAPLRFRLRSHPDILDGYVRVTGGGEAPPGALRPPEASGATGADHAGCEAAGYAATVEAVLREEAIRKVARWEARKSAPEWADGTTEVQPQTMTVYRTGDILYVAVRLKSTTTLWVPEGGMVSSPEFGTLQAFLVESRTVGLGMTVVNLLAVRLPAPGDTGRLSVELTAKDGRRIRVRESGWAAEGTP